MKMKGVLGLVLILCAFESSKGAQRAILTLVQDNVNILPTFQDAAGEFLFVHEYIPRSYNYTFLFQ